MRNTVTKTWSFTPDIALAVKTRAAELGVAESTVVRWAIEKFLSSRTVELTAVRIKRKKKQ